MKHPFILDMLWGLLSHIDNDGKKDGEPGTHSEEYHQTVFDLYQEAAGALMCENEVDNEDQWKFFELVVKPRLQALEHKRLYTPIT